MPEYLIDSVKMLIPCVNDEAKGIRIQMLKKSRIITTMYLELPYAWWRQFHQIFVEKKEDKIVDSVA